MSESSEPGWGGAPQPPPQQSSPPPPADPYGHAGYLPPPQGYGPGYGPGPAAQGTSGMAIAAFAASLASWVVAPVIGAIAALVLAHLGEEEIRKSGGRLAGDWAVTAAKVIAWANIAMAILGILFVIAVIGAFSNFG